MKHYMKFYTKKYNYDLWIGRSASKVIYVWNPINQYQPTWVRIGIYKFSKHIEIHQQRTEQNVVYDIILT